MSNHLLCQYVHHNLVLKYGIEKEPLLQFEDRFQNKLHTQTIDRKQDIKHISNIIFHTNSITASDFTSQYFRIIPDFKTNFYVKIQSNCVFLLFHFIEEENKIMTLAIDFYYTNNINKTIELIENKENTIYYIALQTEKFLSLCEKNPLLAFSNLHKKVVENVSFHYPATFKTALPSFKYILDKLYNDKINSNLESMYIQSKILGILNLLGEYELENQNTEEEINEEMQQLYQAKEILHKELQNPPTIKQLSRMVLLNELKLKQGFKKYFGTTIRNYLIKIRMEAAYSMMLDKNILIFEVALQLGYKDTSHFINTFKKYFGYTPKYFCKNIQTDSCEK